MGDFSKIQKELSMEKLEWFDETKIDAIISATKEFIVKKCRYAAVRRVLTKGASEFLAKSYCKKIDAYRDVIRRVYIKCHGAVYAILKCLGSCISDAVMHQENTLKVGEALAVFEANIDAIVGGGQMVANYNQIEEARRKEQEVVNEITAQGTVDFAEILESGDESGIDKAIEDSVKARELLEKTKEENEKQQQMLQEAQEKQGQPENTQGEQTENGEQVPTTENGEQVPTTENGEAVTNQETTSEATQPEAQAVRETSQPQQPQEVEQPQPVEQPTQSVAENSQPQPTMAVQPQQAEPVAQPESVAQPMQNVAENSKPQPAMAVQPQQAEPVAQSEPVAQPQQTTAPQSAPAQPSVAGSETQKSEPAMKPAMQVQQPAGMQQVNSAQNNTEKK